MNFLKGVVEGAVRESTSWKTYQFGDMTHAVMGTRLQDRWSSLLQEPIDTLSTKRILIVGDGPVALWTAIQIKLLAPNCNVIVRGKHASYARNHVVILDASTLKTPLADRSVIFYNMIQSIGHGISIGDLHAKFLAVAHLVGVVLLPPSAVTSNNLKEECLDKCDLLIGADGAHSVVRQTLFNNALTKTEGTLYVVEVKYLAHHHVEKMSGTQRYALLKTCQRFVTEHVSYDESMQISRITVRFMVSGSEFVAFSGATFACPWTFASDMPSTVVLAMKIWLGARQYYCKEERVGQSERITSFALAPYRSLCFTRAVNQKQVLLVGDAAFGVPFFESFRHGAMCGTLLAHVVLSTRHDAWADYESYVDAASDAAIESARGKQSLVEGASAWCNVSSIMPWQVITIDPELIDAWTQMKL